VYTDVKESFGLTSIAAPDAFGVRVSYDHAGAIARDRAERALGGQPR
jgi:hypothetical protein